MTTIAIEHAHVSWVHPLFLWPFSIIAIQTFTRGYPKRNLWKPLDLLETSRLEMRALSGTERLDEDGDPIATTEIGGHVDVW